MSGGAYDSRLVRNLDALLDVSKAMASAIDLDSLLAVIQTHATEVMEAERGTIFMHHEATGTLWNRASGGLASGDVRLPVGAGIAGHVAQTREMLNVPDAYADPRFNPAVDRQTGFRTRSILCAPLLGREGKLLGVIQVLNKVQGGAFTRQDEALLGAFASHAAVALDRAQLVLAFVEKQRIEEGLRLAHDIQMAMLPRRFPEAREFELTADLRPARSVGGDLYDFLVDEDRVWFIVGDVSGKGVAAALFMAVAKTLFHASVQGAASPASVFARINRELCRDNDGAMFVTAFAGCLDLRTGAVATVNAGHPRPYRLGKDGAVTEVAVASGLPLGVSEGHDYAVGALALEPGESLYLYTDGVTEALNERGEEFSAVRLEACLQGLSGRRAPDVVRGSLAAVQAFAGGTPPSDDIAVMTLRFLARSTPTTLDGPGRRPLGRVVGRRACLAAFLEHEDLRRHAAHRDLSIAPDLPASRSDKRANEDRAASANQLGPNSMNGGPGSREEARARSDSRAQADDAQAAGGTENAVAFLEEQPDILFRKEVEGVVREHSSLALGFHRQSDLARRLNQHGARTETGQPRACDADHPWALIEPDILCGFRQHLGQELLSEPSAAAPELEHLIRAAEYTVLDGVGRSSALVEAGPVWRCSKPVVDDTRLVMREHAVLPPAAQPLRLPYRLRSERVTKKP